MEKEAEIIEKFKYDLEKFRRSLHESLLHQWYPRSLKGEVVKDDSSKSFYWLSVFIYDVLAHCLYVEIFKDRFLAPYKNEFEDFYDRKPHFLKHTLEIPYLFNREYNDLKDIFDNTFKEEMKELQNISDQKKYGSC